MAFLVDTTTAGISVAVLVLAASSYLLLRPTALVKWLQKKNYQYEVTFALYMLTPTEKFIFNSVLFLTVSLLLTATILYLPDHLMTMSRRAYYYCAGDNSAAAGLSRQAVTTATGWAQNAYAAVGGMNKSVVPSGNGTRRTV
ncbi:hypothetical protein MYCGRDRAFT_68786 [Lecanosticta acicola]|uniref:Uncharacterized protein n=1 Tax=Lecanosticta acicola TaxID=111012 RepID=A0AAI9EC57_9PEZI|nr:hypothetical protein MYCGRDRAFT_68786 [Lecanosticta acicola]